MLSYGQDPSIRSMFRQVIILSGITGFILGCTVTTLVFLTPPIVRDDASANVIPIVTTAEAAEEERQDLFALGDPRSACGWKDRAIAWKRDDSFATRLTVWCVEKHEDTEGDNVVAWMQTEGQPFATLVVIQRDFYSHKVLANPGDKEFVARACGVDRFLGWGKGSGDNEGGAIRRGDGEAVRIVGFYGGLVWCVVDDLYALTEGVLDDDNRYDRRFDVAKDVGTEWTL